MIRVAVGIIKKDDRMLVAKRPDDKPYAGYWEFPGGKIERDESGRDALARELHEELGIKVETAMHLFDHIHSYPDKTVFLELWFVSDFDGEPHSKESQTLLWANFADLQDLKLLEGNIAIMQKLQGMV